MKPIHLYITLLAASLMVSCSEVVPDVVSTKWPDGEAPLAIKPIMDAQSRDNQNSTIQDFINLDGTDYDIYCFGVLYGNILYTGYYTYDGITKKFFTKMMYDVDNKMLYIPGHCYPTVGNLDLLTFGLEKGKSISPSAYPPNEQLNQGTFHHVDLDLTDGYDGSFDIIAADRVSVECKYGLNVEDLPDAHYYHLLSHIEVRIKWDDGIEPDASIIDRIAVKSLRIDNTPWQGICRITTTVADAEWVELDPPHPMWS